jgi:hypothetical protein
MIDVALTFLVSELNAFLEARTGSSEGGAVLCRLVEDGGKVAIPQTKIGAALINIEEDRALKSPVPTTTLAGGRHVTLQPDVKLNLSLLFAANFTSYTLALQQLSWVVTFFQAHPGFSRERQPGLDPRIERLTVELQSLTFDQVNQVWAAVGGKQLPSVVYRVRVVALQDIQPSSVQPPVLEVASTLHGS